MYNEQMIACMDCGTEFQFTAEEQEFYQSKGFEPPRRCKPCRSARKASRQGGGGGGRGGYGGGGGRGGYGGGGGFQQRELFDVVCDACGIQTQVPFKPQEGRQVFCRECLKSSRSAY